MKHAGIIVLFIFFWCGEQVFSQTKSNSFVPELSFGFNGGITLSRVGFNSIYFSVPQTLLRQYSGGIAVRYISESHFGIQGELNYSMRGWKERTDSAVNNNSYARSIGYVELPLLTHIYFNLGKRVRFIFNAGPQFCYYIGEKNLEYNITDNKLDPVNNPQQTVSYYDTRVQHPFDYGLKGMLGLEFRTKAGSVILDGRYYYGLSDIFSNQKQKHDWFQASHNQVIGLNLSYLFVVKK